LMGTWGCRIWGLTCGNARSGGEGMCAYALRSARLVCFAWSGWV
jgi:hypothetical protein